MQIDTFLQVMKNVGECESATMSTLTNVSLKGGRKNPFQNRVQKRMINAKVVLCASNDHVNGYQSTVRNRLVSEGKSAEAFVLQPRKWGSRMMNAPVVEHVKDGVKKYYLEVIFESGGSVEYLVDGVTTNPSEIEGLELSKPESEDSQCGLTNKVVIRTFDMDSVVELRINNQVFN
jgi:hypothetical protein